MSRLAWFVLAAFIVVLAAGVLLLDRHQARRGMPSLFGLSWEVRAGRDRPGPRERQGVPEGAEPTRAVGRGQIAVIIDQLGGRTDVFDRVVGLDRPIAVAVLPGLPLSRRIAREAPRAGLEVFLQLPLEPYRSAALDPGAAALTTAMAPAEVSRRTRDLLVEMPGIMGVVTHMGSRFTEDPVRMRALLEVVRDHELAFVDRLTTHRSVGYDLARALGLQAGRRQVLLDLDDSGAIGRARLGEVERWAAQRGSVVAIGRGRPLTLELLEEALERWERRGLRLVPVSRLLDPGSGPGARGRARALRGAMHARR